MESETKACMAHTAIARTMTAMFNECAAIEAIFSMFHVKQLLFIVHGAVKTPATSIIQANTRGQRTKQGREIM